MRASAPEPPRRFPAHYLWAVLITRIYEVFPLVCPFCGGNRRILEHIGVDIQAPRIAPARGPPLWDECDAQGVDGALLGRSSPDAPGRRARSMHQLVGTQTGDANARYQPYCGARSMCSVVNMRTAPFRKWPTS